MLLDCEYSQLIVSGEYNKTRVQIVTGSNSFKNESSLKNDTHTQKKTCSDVMEDCKD